MKKYIKKWISDIENDLRVCKSKDCKGCETLRIAKERFENDLSLLEEKKEVEIKMQSFDAQIMEARLGRDKYILNEVTFTFESDHRVFSIADPNKFTQIKTLKELNKTLKKIV